MLHAFRGLQQYLGLCYSHYGGLRDKLKMMAFLRDLKAIYTCFTGSSNLVLDAEQGFGGPQSTGPSFDL